MEIETYSEPMKVTAVGGEVVVLGPDRLGGSFTPDAAEVSARHLLAAAAEARGQQSEPQEPSGA